MRLYLASRFETGKRVWPAVHEQLVMLGYDVCSTWYIEQEHKTDEQLTQDERRKPADRDLAQLDAADTFVMLNPAADYENDRTCGRHHEMGYMICRRRRSQVEIPKFIIIGTTRSVFHAYADVVLNINGHAMPPTYLAMQIDKAIRTLYASYPACYR